MARSIPVKNLPIQYNPQLSGYTIYEDGLHTYIITLKSLTDFLGESIISGVTEELNIEISNRISGDTFLFSLITGETENRISSDTYLQINKFDVTGGTIYGNIIVSSGNTITGDGSGLYNIPASGVTGLELDRITNGSYSAIISNSGFTVNTNTYIQGNLDAQSISVSSTGLTTNLNSDLLDGYHANDFPSTNSFNAHTGDTSIHLTSSQNTWLDSISATSTEVNYLIGLTGNVQTQINTKSSLGHTHYELYKPTGGTPTVYVDNGGNLHIDADIYQNGSGYTTHAEQIYTTKDYIFLRSGATAGLSNGQYTGFEAIKYDGANNGRLVFDNTGTARVGDVGFEQPLATRNESTGMTNGDVVIWDGVNSKLITNGINLNNLDSRYVNTTGDTMTGNLIIQGSLKTSDIIQIGTGSTPYFVANKAGILTNALGANAGAGSTATYSNFLGFSAGKSTTSNFNTLIGLNAGNGTYDGSIGQNNIIIGNNISLPQNTVNYMNLGGVIFTDGIYNNVDTLELSYKQDAVTTAKVGIATSTPRYTLDVNGDTFVNGNITGTTLVKSGGSADQYLMANGSVTTTGSTQSYYDSRYVNVTGDTMTGGLTIPNLKVNTYETIGNLSSGGTITLSPGTINEYNVNSSLNVNQSISNDGGLRNSGIVSRLQLDGTVSANKYATNNSIEILSTNNNNITGSLRGSQSSVSLYNTGSTSSAIGSFNTISNNGKNTLNGVYGSYNTVANINGTINGGFGSFNAVINTGGTVTNMYGSYNNGLNINGALTTGGGTYSNFTQSGTGTTNLGYAADLYVNNASTGVINTAIGLGIDLNNNGTGTIGTLYGISVGGPNDVWNNSGTIDNSYGVYLGSSIDVGTNRYAFYSNSTSASYFSGKLGIGVVPTTGMTDKLTVSGNTTVHGNLTVTDKTTLKYVVDSNGFTGNTNDTLISTTTGVTWVDISSTVNLKSEFPTGDINGINKFFTTSQPYVSGSLLLFINGIKDSHFNEVSDTQIEIETPPSNVGFSDIIEVTYIIK